MLPGGDKSRPYIDLNMSRNRRGGGQELAAFACLLPPSLKLWRDKSARQGGRRIEDRKKNRSIGHGVKDFPPLEVLQTVLEQEKRSGAGRGIYFREKLGWVLVGIALGVIMVFLSSSTSLSPLLALVKGTEAAIPHALVSRSSWRIHPSL